MSAPAGSSTRFWVVAALVRWPLRGLSSTADRVLTRLVCLLASKQVMHIDGWESIFPERDPFLLVANHSSRREAVFLPAILILARGGRTVRFLADWNFRLIPGVGHLYDRSGVITLTGKSARPRLFNLLKPLFEPGTPPLGDAKDHLLRGGSIGIFPEGTVNRRADRLLRGRRAAARISLETGAPLVPTGIRIDRRHGRTGLVDSSSAMTIDFGEAMTPQIPTEEPILPRTVTDWNTRLMNEIGGLCGKVKVLRATYQVEKGWIREAESQIPQSDLASDQVSWFLSRQAGEPAGVLRVHYAPPVEQYRAYGLRVLRPGIDVARFLRTSRLAEIGRFAIAPKLRRNLLISVALMRAATRETLEREFTHYITDVFENDPHSPYGFHTRVMGVDPVAAHDHGELHCSSRRITMILDLKAAYHRLRQRKGWIFRTLTADWDERLHLRLTA